jgi:hypothetical protein
MRIAALIVMGLICTNCALIARREANERAAMLQTQSTAAFNECQSRFPPNNPKTTIARTTCINESMRILRPIMPYPDLLELQLATNMSIAEKVQNGQMTVAQANEAIAQKFSEVSAEEQRRLLASRAVGAQESAAAAAWESARPKTCMGGPAVIGCF